MVKINSKNNFNLENSKQNKKETEPQNKKEIEINNLQTEENSEIKTSNSEKEIFIAEKTKAVSELMFKEDKLAEIKACYPPEKLSIENYPEKKSLEIIAKTLEIINPHLNTKILENDPQKLLDLLRNNPQYSKQIKEELAKIYSTEEIIQIFISISASAVKSEQSENGEINRNIRATRDGLQPVGAVMAFGKTGWLENSGIPEASDALVVLANFSTLINIKKWKGEIVSGDIGLDLGGNLEFATVNGISYAFTHFDGTFGPTGSISVKLDEKNILKLSGEILHESTHLGDNAMQEGMKRHDDSAEWLGTELSFQHLNSQVEFEIYGSVEKYFHSMTQHPLDYRLEGGFTLSVLDRKLNLSAGIDTVKAGESSKQRLVGDIEGFHTGGKVKLLLSPTGNGTGITAAYEFGNDPFGQNIGETNNRFLIGFQTQDHLPEIFKKNK